MRILLTQSYVQIKYSQHVLSLQCKQNLNGTCGRLIHRTRTGLHLFCNRLRMQKDFPMLLIYMLFSTSARHVRLLAQYINIQYM